MGTTWLSLHFLATLPLRVTNTTDNRLAPATTMVVEDVAPVEAAIPGMNVNRLDRGRNETELTLAVVDEIEMCIGRFDFKVATEVGIAADELRVGLQLEEGTGSWNGNAFDLDRFWVYRQGAEHSGAAEPHKDGRGATWATFVLPLDCMADAAASDVVDRADLISVHQTDTRALRAVISDILTEAQKQAFTVDQARRARRELLETTVSLVHSAGDAPHRIPSAHAITRQCVAVADDLDPIPTTADLAAALDVSDRWIRMAFNRVYGVSVTEFFRARALHRARRYLANSDPTSTTVAEIAIRCGFWHLGRFSGYYRAHFGEHPRRTLSRGA